MGRGEEVEVEVEVESKVGKARSRSRQRRGEFGGLGLKANPVASGGPSPCLIPGFLSTISGLFPAVLAALGTFQVELFLTAMLMPS